MNALIDFIGSAIVLSDTERVPHLDECTEFCHRPIDEAKHQDLDKTRYIRFAARSLSLSLSLSASKKNYKGSTGVG